MPVQGYSRVPVGEAGTYHIMRQRDARDQPIPTILASQNEAPPLPNNWDLCTLKYKATHADVIEDIARTCRSFMPAASRIIPELITGTLLITDTAINLKKLYGIIKDMDQKPTAELKKRWSKQVQIKPEQPQKSAGSN